MVDILLDLSRLQTGAMPISIRSTPIQDVVHGVVASLPADRSEVVIELDGALPAVESDPGLLERTVANVLANALEFSPPGQYVRIEAGLVGDRVEIRVSDQGPGIPPDRRDQLFKPFQRLGDRPERARRGLGLGLAIARGFLEAMGGELTLEDTPGGGATFVFSLITAEHRAATQPKPLASGR